MLAAFPETPPKIIGTPSLQEMIRVMYHLMLCSQTHDSQASGLGLLFACLPQALWASYSQDPYPNDPINPCIVLQLDPVWTPTQVSNYKAQWEYIKKMYGDFRTMNSALTDRFLSLIDAAYTADFTNASVTQPDVQFRECFTYFLGRYGATNESERSANKEAMKTPWTLQDGWERLQKQMDDGHIYSIFANATIPDTELVDIAITVINQTGLFTNQYEQWHKRASNAKTWADFKTFWKAKIKLKADTSLNASSFGFGGNTAQTPAGNDVDFKFNNSVANFVTAHNQTQGTIAGLAQTNANLNSQMQQQPKFTNATDKICNESNANESSYEQRATVEQHQW